MEDKGYGQICNSYRQLADIRFKLLAFVPTISGAAIAIITQDLSVFQASPLPGLMVAVLGFTVTLGIVFYDQRNTQLYDALVNRGRRLEKELGIRGPFLQRQPRTLKLFGLIKVWHDRGLALTYGSLLGAWTFPIACGMQWLCQPQKQTAPDIAVVLALIVGIAFVFEFHRLQRRPKKVVGQKAEELRKTTSNDQAQDKA
ncbi:MAG: hypothetical protein D3906_14660 [Candidatus Electrothrix sp. AUS1_2]|nr:hypothetical protein [Candidatus Electrothrix sp. AUS1_2]